MLTVRPLEPPDVGPLAELTARVYLDEGLGDEGYEPALRDVAGRAATATVLVAVLHEQPAAGPAAQPAPDRPATGAQGHLVGGVTVATRGGPWAERAVQGEAVIRMLAVDPAARGTGAGAALVAACLDAARSDGCHLLRLSTQPASTAAHRLYDRFGFTRTPEHDWTPVPGIDLLGYALPLVPWCDVCGNELTGSGHEDCRGARALEPPRFCGRCRRRMVVQVLPTGWTARCVEHGTRAG